MNLVFAGTPEFAALILGDLLRSRTPVMAVLTQPDRPAGRGKALRASPVKALAEAAGRPLYQPQSLRGPQTLELLAGIEADAMVVAAYGLILPPAVLKLFPLGCINVHASLLPRWRGAAPIQRAILAGDAHTGISIMRMDRGLDSGDVYARRQCPIEEDDTAGSLHDRLAALGSLALQQVLRDIDDGSALALPQDHTLATYAAKLDKNEARLDWNQSANHLARCVRAYHPWPVAFAYLGEPTPASRIRVHAALPVDTASAASPGTVIAVGADYIDVACGSGSLRILTLQRSGKQAAAAAIFLRGTPVAVGERMQ